MKELIRFRDFIIGYCRHCYSGMVIGRKDHFPTHPDEYAVRYGRERVGSKPSACWDLFVDATEGLRDVQSVLDVGCGNGDFLDIARARGLRTAGMELSPESSRTAAGSGHRVWIGSILDRLPSEIRGFDAVTMWDVLEHLSEPRKALKRAREALRPGGHLLLVTPMMGSAYDRLGIAALRASRGRVDQLVRMCWSDDHLFRFHPRGLCRALQGVGFGRVRARPVLLLSLAAGAYGGGEIFPGWTPNPRLNHLLSHVGVRAARLYRFHNKVLVDATREHPDAA